MEAQAAAAAKESANSYQPENIVKSPSDFSCHSYELFVEQEKGQEDNNRERQDKISIRYDPILKNKLSLQHQPFVSDRKV